MKKQRFLVLILSFGFIFTGFYNVPAFSQANRSKPDSLLSQLQNEKDSEKRMLLYFDLADAYKCINMDTVIMFSGKSLSLARQHGQPENMARACVLLGKSFKAVSQYDSSLYYLYKAREIGMQVDEVFLGSVYNNLANTYEFLNMIDSALYFHREGIKIKEKYEDLSGLSTSFNNLGRIYWRQNDYPAALNYFFKSLEIKRKLNDCPVSVSKTLTNIGSVYFQTQQYDEALRYYKDSRKLKEDGGDIRGIGILSNNIASVYLRRNQLDSALVYYEKSLGIREELSDFRGMAGVLSNMASVYRHMGNFSRSGNYQHKALEIRRDINDTHGIVASLTNLGRLYMDQNLLEESETYLLQAFGKAVESQFLDVKAQIAMLLTGLYSEKRDYKTALEYHKVFHETREAIIDESTMQRMQELENSFERRQEQEIRRREKAEFAASRADLRNSKRRVLYLVVLSTLLMLSAGLLFMLYRSNIRYNKKLKSLNKDLDHRVMVRTSELQKENDYRAGVEKELKKSEKKYRTVTETVNAGIAIADVNEKITFMNEAFARMLGYDPEELLGETLDMIVNKSTFKKFKKETQYRKKGESNRYFINIHCKDGAVKDAVLTASPLFDENEEFIGGVAALTDITDLRKSQKTVEDALKRTQEIDFVKSRYLKHTSDDLRTFLNNILGTSEILQRNLDEGIDDVQEQRELLQTIQHGAEDIRNELPNFITVSQLSIEDMSEKNQSLNLNQIIEKCIDNQKENHIEAESMDEQVTVYGNPQFLETIITALIQLATHNINQPATVHLRKDHVKKTANIIFSYPESDALLNALTNIGPGMQDTDEQNTDTNYREMEGNLDWQWVRKKLLVQNGKLEVVKQQGQYKLVLSVPMDYDSYESNKCKDSLVELLEDRIHAIYILSNDKELKSVKDQLNEKMPNVHLIENASRFFNLKEDELALLDNSLVLIDCSLDEPWTSSKALLELKRHNGDRSISFVEVKRGTCELNENKMLSGSSGFDACITVKNCFQDLHSFLDRQ